MYFTSNLDKALKDAKIILICVNTPTKGYGEGANKAFDLKFIENVTRQIAEYYNDIELSEEVIIVEKSTVPVCTSKYIKEILQENQNNFKSNKEKFIILSNPEFLAEDMTKITFLLQNYFYSYVVRFKIFFFLIEF